MGLNRTDGNWAYIRIVYKENGMSGADYTSCPYTLISEVPYTTGTTFKPV